MKKILFLLLLTTGTTHAQDYRIKIFYPEATNKPLTTQLDSTIQRGEHIISDNILMSEIDCYMNVMKRRYYTDSSHVAVLESITEYRDDISIRADTSAKKRTKLMYLIYLDSVSHEVVTERLNIRFTVPEFGYASYFENYLDGKRTLELYVVSKDYGHGRYNLTTGISCETIRDGVVGKDKCWEELVNHNGFFYLLEELEHLTE